VSRSSEAKVRALAGADTAAALELLRQRPVHNVLLEHLVRAGALSRLPGFFGCEVDGALEAVLMVGALGGSSLEVRRAEAFRPLAEWVGRLAFRPRHLTGSEDVTVPFWNQYQRFAGTLLWERRERVYVLSRERFARTPGGNDGGGAPREAQEHELDALVRNSAQQHREDLKEDRFAMDPAGFRARHRSELREGHWWVVEEGGELCFQVHVGPFNGAVIQLGGVFTPAEVRGRGHATRGLRALVALLLREHPAVSLFCDDANDVACRLYERVGFERRFYNRSYLLAAEYA
jgi:RimJ/RimL family protein N-acetyltransferase